MDNASTDPAVKDYINNLEPPCSSFKKFFRTSNEYPYGIRKAKNKARQLASGEYFIDSPDDHVFFLKSHWLKDTITFLETEAQIGCVCHYAYPYYRFAKPNNKMSPSNEDKNYLVSLHKAFADYNVMSRKVYNDIGPFREDLPLNLDSSHELYNKHSWTNPSCGNPAESEYIERSAAKGYTRALPFYPCAVPIFTTLGFKHKSVQLIAPIDLDTYKSHFPNRSLPVSYEETFSYLLKHNLIK